MITIAVDCGASFLKMARVCDGKIVKCMIYSQEEMNMLHVYEEDRILPKRLQTIVSAIRNGILELTEVEESVMFAMSNEMHGFVLTDVNCIPVKDYVSWQTEWILERREEKQTWQQYFYELLEESDVQNTGMPFKPGLPSGNLAYMISKKMLANDTHYFYTLGDFVLSWLTKEDIPMHVTNAAATGLYDIVNDCWNQSLIRALRINKIIFRPLAKSDESVSWRWELRNFRVFPAIGDQQAALLGSGLRQKNQLSINMGTGAQVSVLTSELKFSRYYQTRPFFDGNWLLTIPHIPSGRALNVFFYFVKEIVDNFSLDKYSDESVWNWIDQKVNKAFQDNLNCLEIDLSFFSNAMTDRTTGKIEEIKEFEFRVGNVFLAVYRKMAENVHKCTSQLCYDEEVQEILFSGGVVRKSAILQKLILKCYPTDCYKISKDETLYGIDKYVNQEVCSHERKE